MGTKKDGQQVQAEEKRAREQEEKSDQPAPRIGEGSAEGAKPNIKHETKREDQVDNTPGNVAQKESSGQKQDAKDKDANLSDINEQMKGSDADHDQAQGGGI